MLRQSFFYINFSLLAMMKITIIKAINFIWVRQVEFLSKYRKRIFFITLSSNNWIFLPFGSLLVGLTIYLSLFTLYT